jgi:hypothetical protein
LPILSIYQKRIRCLDSPGSLRCSAYVLGGRLRGRTRDSGFDTTATESTLNRPATVGDQLIGLIFHMSG